MNTCTCVSMACPGEVGPGEVGPGGGGSGGGGWLWLTASLPLIFSLLPTLPLFTVLPSV